MQQKGSARMQLLYLTEPREFNLTEFIRIKFDGNLLAVYLNNALCGIHAAKPGDAFQVFSVGQHSSPVIEKVRQPLERGERIAWALCFQERLARTSSYQEFLDTYQKVMNAYPSEKYFIEECPEAYAFVLATKPKNPKKPNKPEKKKPLLAWVSDDISDENLDKLIEAINKYRKISAPIEFVKAL